VEPESFKKLYEVEEEDMGSFCTSCCREHICDVYGKPSDELSRFNKGIKELRHDAAEVHSSY
jgi:hypothetical protein